MIKIEAVTLEQAYSDAADSLECSVIELKTEVVQYPSSGFLGLFKKSAIIVATRVSKPSEVKDNNDITKDKESNDLEENNHSKNQQKHNIINDTIMPESFVSDQEDDEELDPMEFTADYDDKYDENDSQTEIYHTAQEVKKDINSLFSQTCFNIDEIEVSVYDENTLLIEFKGEDAALLIGKEGYRYKALSYMIFNWVNSKYQVQLRLEIAEFLKNQEESVLKYLETVCESIDRDGRAQTKILDGVLIQIALKELRDRYPDKYVVIRSNRDGLKYIIINDYHSN
jgi:spoIIIJ-associated protein